MVFMDNSNSNNSMQYNVRFVMMIEYDRKTTDIRSENRMGRIVYECGAITES